MTKVFFSYSHIDEELRDGLEVHLTSLKRQGIIETWHDRRITAGDEHDVEISTQLNNADIVLLLVSPHFIASDYCYGREMNRAMQRHEEGTARIIPVILRPCDWHSLQFGRLLATPDDGIPITKFPNRDDAFLQVTRAIRKAAIEISPSTLGSDTTRKPYVGNQVLAEMSLPSSTEDHTDIRSSNLRVKKHFTEYEKHKFLDDAFDYIANFFESSLAELEHRNTPIDTRFRRIDSNSFTANIYEDENLKSSCRIWMGDNQALGGIAYSENERNFSGSTNESLSVVDDGYSLFLKPLLGNIQRSEDKCLTYEGGAEHLWEKLIKPLQG